MGKIKKIKGNAPKEHVPLDEAIEKSNFAKPTGRVKNRTRQDEEEFVNTKLSRKIIHLARKQQEELIDDVGVFGDKDENINFKEFEKEHEFVENKDDFVELAANLESIDPEEEKAFEIFMNKNPAPRKLLSDIIMEKISDKQNQINTHFSDVESLNVSNVSEEMVQVFKGVGEVLSKYRSGKLPKAFKIIPRLPNWEQILNLTNPDNWSSASMYQAVRIFVSNLQEKMAQRFFNLVLLPRIRDEIAEYKRLNYHLYQSLKKALFKPGAFMKGILLPLCESRSCSLREAIIIGSVLKENSIPVIHSSAGMLKIAEMEYSGANSVFLRIILDKKYALPYRVIDALVAHFARFSKVKESLPVLWHQALLTFAQRYKQDISSEQRDSLLELLKIQSHPKVTFEIRRELRHANTRDFNGELEDNAMGPMIVN